MIRLKVLLFAGLLGFLPLSNGYAGFVLSVNPDDLTFSGPGAHSVDVVVTHDGSGLSTFSGYSIRFGPVPSGASLDGAVEVLVFDDFTFDAPTKDVSGLNLLTDADLGVSGSATLFTLQYTLGGDASYVMPFDFLGAIRGDFSSSVDISSEFTAPTSFTLMTSTAVPEPGSFAALSLVAGLIGYRHRRKRQLAGTANA